MAGGSDNHALPPSPQHDGGMASRGVTRPMALHHLRQHHREHAEEDEQEQQGEMGRPYGEQRGQMQEMHHQQTLWIPWTLILLGAWMMLSPVTHGTLNPELWVEPSGGRGVWFSDELYTEFRAWLMAGSDLVSGALLMVLGWRSLRPGRPVSRWAACLVGVWLNLAPLVFWAPTAASYVNGTLVGTLVIALTVLVPGMPNMILYMKEGPETPPGWSYNPSSWPQRWIMMATAFLGWLVSRYLTGFQLGYINEVWEPFFGQGSRRVLNSDMSHTWPISDAGLGALAYTFEFLMGWMGSPARWRTMPWMVTFFGILVIPLGLVHIALVISQPVVVGHWCTLCLLAAAIMLPMIPLQVDEVIAMGQFLAKEKKAGRSLWHAFWKGGTMEGGGPDERTPPLVQMPEAPGKVLHASVWGLSIPWSLGLSSVLGIGLMFVPSFTGMVEMAADLLHLGGALIVVVSVICWAEPLRAGRFLNIVLGLGVAVAPWFLAAGTLGGQIIGLVVGLIVAGLSLPRGQQTQRYGSWDRFIL